MDVQTTSQVPPKKEVWCRVDEPDRNSVLVRIWHDAVVYDAMVAALNLEKLDHIAPGRVLVKFNGNDVDNGDPISYYTTSSRDPLLLELPEPEGELAGKKPRLEQQTEDKAATEFLKGLLSNDITQRNGLNIIEVSCGPPWSKSTWSLYVRQAYVDLHAKIEATAKDVVIIGNPGIGKSYFALYELYLAVKANKMVVFYHQLTNATYVFDPMERKGFQDDFNTPCLLEAPVYLYDCGTKTPSTYPRTKSARMTMFSSPYRLNYIDALKTGALKLCMPVWSEVEVLNYGKYQYGDDELAENLSKFGGIPRYVFSEEHQKMEWLERLHLLCKSCTIETLDRLKGNRLDDEDSHMIFHLDSADDYKSYTIVFASYYVEGLVYTAIEEARKNGVVRFLNSAVAPMFASLQGHLFEWKAHEVLQEGGVFRTRCLDPPESEKRVTLATTSLEMFNKDTDIDWNAGSLYWRPKARNYPSLDAYMTPDIGFQMTVSGTHKIKAGGLKIIPANTNFKLYFVVPKRNFTCFKKQTIDTEGVAATIQQHALCLELKEY